MDGRDRPPPAWPATTCGKTSAVSAHLAQPADDAKLSSLAAKNVHDMKWKKFLYKQLWRREGINTARAQLEYCTDYLKCFGPEE